MDERVLSDCGDVLLRMGAFGKGVDDSGGKNCLSSKDDDMRRGSSGIVGADGRKETDGPSLFVIATDVLSENDDRFRGWLV
jgi:hypothetical protein